MRLIVLCGILFCWNNIPVHALGDDFMVGNGGDGVYIGENLRLLDFVEVGIEDNPYFITEAVVRQDYLLRVQSAFAFAVPAEKIVLKLMEIEKISPVLSLVLLKAMEMYNWRMVNYELINVEDEDTTVVGELIQLAIRRRSSILINEGHWNALDEANKAGLIFHELIYALIEPLRLDGYRIQHSLIARDINAYLFSGELILNGYESLFQIVSMDTGNSLLPIAGIKAFEKDGNIFSRGYIALSYGMRKSHPEHDDNDPFFYNRKSSLINGIITVDSAFYKELCEVNQSEILQDRIARYSVYDKVYSLKISSYSAPNGRMYYLKWENISNGSRASAKGSLKYISETNLGEVDSSCVSFMQEAVANYYDYGPESKDSVGL